MDAAGNRPHVVVVGGGIAGLTAAWQLRRRAGDRLDVTVLEGTPQVGGKLRVSDVAGLPVDEGAESMLARRPEGVELAGELGLEGDLVAPATTSAAVWAGGALRPIPGGHVMGVPADLDRLRESELLTPAGLAAVEEGGRAPAPPLTEDVAVGPYVAARMGGEIVDRLVEPLLGGVYAGRADVLSLHATLPQLVPYLREDGSLLAAARAASTAVASAASTARPGPVFTTLRGGMGRLPGELADRCGARVRTSATVRELHRTPDGWSLAVGSRHAPEDVRADAVVLAVPARPASRLLSGAVPAAVTELAGIDYASIALATFAYPRSAFPRPPAGSGFLVPASAGRLVKAVTFFSTKWAHLGGDLVVVRCSLGRYGDERRLQRDDADLLRLAATELGSATGVHGAWVDARLTRWGGALPQYAVGHLDRVARIERAVESVPGLAVCGAAYRGVGIPACVASGRAAADRVLGDLARCGRIEVEADVRR